MASATIKSTYSLDLETHDAIEKMAKRLNTSKSNVIRQAVRVLRLNEPANPDVARRLEAARRLQNSMRKRKVDTTGWLKAIRDARR